MTSKRHNPSRRGVSLIESVAAMVILAGAMAASMNSVASARASQVMVAERAKARVLAESMLQEVLAQPYAEPGSSTLGPDAGEGGTAIRNQYDDVDDYDGWTNTVRTPNGTDVLGFEGYKMTFEVKWVDRGMLVNTIGSDQGVKRIVVTITRNGRAIAEARGWAVSP